jgi:hypothetical protein
MSKGRKRARANGVKFGSKHEARLAQQGWCRLQVAAEVALDKDRTSATLKGVMPKGLYARAVDHPPFNSLFTLRYKRTRVWDCEGVKMPARKFQVGDRVEDKKTHERGRVTFVYSTLELRDEFIAVLFNGTDEALAVPADSVRKLSTRQS